MASKLLLFWRCPCCNVATLCCTCCSSNRGRGDGRPASDRGRRVGTRWRPYAGRCPTGQAARSSRTPWSRRSPLTPSLSLLHPSMCVGAETRPLPLPRAPLPPHALTTAPPSSKPCPWLHHCSLYLTLPSGFSFGLQVRSHFGSATATTGGTSSESKPVVVEVVRKPSIPPSLLG
jgi:hypothetical protein